MREPENGPIGDITDDALQPPPPADLGPNTPFDGQDMTDQPVTPEPESYVLADDKNTVNPQSSA